jgi:hypothetical protein
MKWVSFELEEGCKVDKTAANGDIYFTMRPQEECFVKYSIKVPETPPSGAQYMSIFIEQVPKEEAEGVEHLNRFGILLRGNVNDGKASISGKIIQQTTPFWVVSGALETTTTIKNDGNMDFNAEIELEVKKLFGGVAYKTEEPVRYAIMAETTRVVPSDWNEPKMGIYKVKQTVRMLGTENIKEGWCLVMPMWFLMVVLAALVVCVLAVVYGRKEKRSNSKKRR